ncbi:unnamed protein product [Rotaria sp. Silwood2]|nr:unnamed protein product [Rotaria sp. Silwood2]CAF2705615.1 unnamed protein product [Rotaria sp. Silwood2]CAF3100222.1 unnamed protein product [Rotaria sp. Silwood2]CAF3987286.1 unnamed protein product [Rotaria sp. Silwood2]CAF4057134.1 unnamed protein product [Rotaria sp. Silwood2]
MLLLIVVVYVFNVYFIASSSVNNVTVALLQMLSDNDTKENILIADRYCRQAASLNADIALMPEMWNSGYSAPFPSYNASNKQPVRD